MKTLLLDLSVRLAALSTDSKNFQYVPAAINAARYILEQLNALEHWGKFSSFLNNKHWSAQPHSFFNSSADLFPADSTNQEVLSQLIQDLAKKISQMKPENHTTKALNTFIENVSNQLTLFKTSVHKNHDSASTPEEFTFLSNFRKRKTIETKETDRHLNQPMNYA